MKNLLSKIFVAIFCFGLLVDSSAQTKIIASLDFDPKINGFGFKNYKNEGEKWKDDIGAEDLIRMFGVKAVCKSGDSAKNCVLKAAARKWIEYYLEAMNIGHCEGIGVASLRMNTNLPFKKKLRPPIFNPERSRLSAFGSTSRLKITSLIIGLLKPLTKSRCKRKRRLNAVR